MIKACTNTSKFAFEKIKEIGLKNYLKYEYRRTSNCLSEPIEDLKKSIQDIINSKNRIANKKNTLSSLEIKKNEFCKIFFLTGSKILKNIYKETFTVLKNTSKNAAIFIKLFIIIQKTLFFSCFSRIKFYSKERNVKIKTLNRIFKLITKDIKFRYSRCLLH